MISLKCPICQSTTETVPLVDSSRYVCPRCGTYELTASGWQVLSAAGWTARQIANASGWIREHQGVEILARDIAFLGSLRTPSVDDRAMKILIEMERSSKRIGQLFIFQFADPSSLLDWLSVSWSDNVDELEYLVSKYLMALDLVEGKRTPSNASAVIAPHGYDQLAKLRQGGLGSAIGFCAMWFDSRLLPIWADAISPAIEGAGYKAERIDRVEHNNKIDDEIIAMIRKSRFVVADFTGNRGGVYFEAGFATGLGVPVIWTIRERRYHRVHFDNRQYNFIGWDAANLHDFRSRLQNRIEATLGAGPLARLGA